MKHVKRFLIGLVVLAGIVAIGLGIIALWIEIAKLQIYPYVISGVVVLVLLCFAYKIGEAIAE